MPVPDELPCLRTGGGEAKTVGDVVEPPFEQLQECFASNTASALRLFEVTTELILQHAVNALDLLLLAQLHAVSNELRLSRLAVLAGHKVALFKRALLRIAALAFEEQFDALAAAEATDGANVTSHSKQH